MNMSASIVSQEKNNLIVPTSSEKTQALCQAAREELLFPAYATLPVGIVVSDKYFSLYIHIHIHMYTHTYIYSHRN